MPLVNILSPADFPSVRAAIDVSIGKAELPDATISLDIYLGAAESWAKRIDEKWAERTGEDANSLRRGATLFLAALLIRAIPFLTRESYGNGEGVFRQEVDVEARANELETRAVSQINSYILEPDTPKSFQLPTMFKLGQGSRGV